LVYPILVTRASWLGNKRGIGYAVLITILFSYSGLKRKKLVEKWKPLDDDDLRARRGPFCKFIIDKIVQRMACAMTQQTSN